ncbi:glutathione transferase GstA [Cedecea lapagei]|uniref:glutathione transferase GstA n=1 Tax=Cedecea lapagei TaxID=158823 RepID=UPI001BD11680|nr:glutathione transferase GstA [Cedecea lapagei]
MKLYYAPKACSLSPHIVLRELELEFELIKVDNKNKLTADGRDFFTVTPKGYVAALELDNGEILTEGTAIVQYLADLQPEKGLAPLAGSWARVRLQEWLNFITSELHAASAPLFNASLPEEVKAIFREKFFKRLDFVQDTLSKTVYLTGSTFSVADAYLYTVLSWGKMLSIDLNQWPAIASYLAAINARPAVQEALRVEETH